MLERSNCPQPTLLFGTRDLPNLITQVCCSRLNKGGRLCYVCFITPPPSLPARILVIYKISFQLSSSFGVISHIICFFFTFLSSLRIHVREDNCVVGRRLLILIIILVIYCNRFFTLYVHIIFLNLIVG